MDNRRRPGLGAMWKLAIGAALALGGADVAHATCMPVKPALPVVDPSRPLPERVAVLQARSFWIDDGTEAPAWRAVVADIARQPGTDPELEAIAETELAAALFDDASTDEQLAHAVKGQALAQQHGLTGRPSYVRILTQLIYKQVIAGHIVEAEAYSAPLLIAARRDFGEHSLEWAAAQSATGWVAYNLGRYEESLPSALIKRDVLRECLPADDHRIADAMTGYAASLSGLGRVEEALPEAFRGARWASEHLPDDHPSQVYTLRSLGIQLGVAGRWPESEAVLRRAVDLQTTYHRDDAQGRALTLSQLARSIDDQGRHLEAEALWGKAVALYAGVKNRSSGMGAAVMLRRSADSAELRGDLPTALTRRDAALAAITLPPDNANRAAVVLERAQTLALMGRGAEAKTAGAPAYAILVAKSPPADPRLVFSTVQWARIVAAADGPAAGRTAMAPAVARMEALLLDTTAPHSDLAALAPLFSGGLTFQARLALETGHDEEAFRALQLAGLSQIVLATTDAAARDLAREPAERALVTQLQDAVLHRRALERERSAALGDGGAASAVQARLDAADAAIAKVAAEVDRRFPDFRQRSRPAPIGLAAFRATLGANEMLLAPIPFEGGTLVVAVTRDGLTWARSAVSSFAIAGLTQRIRASIGEPQRPFDVAAARALYAAVAPTSLRPALRRHPSLLWYAAGPLAALPPALLVEPTRTRAVAWLIRSHAITVLPSLTPPPPRPARQLTASFLGIGAPLLGGGGIATAARGLTFRGAAVETQALGELPTLAGAARELRAMQTLLGPGGRVLAGPAATEAALKAMPLDGYRVVAFATHGLQAGDIGGLIEPALVMTPPAQTTPGDDGLLTASEIAALHLDADWVILSACDTASGGEGGAPEYAGLASAFVQAGARALLVSHWPVRDDAAARLTVDTVKEARTAPSRAAALQRAMLRLMADRHLPGAAHPAVWAPFVLIGR